MDNSEKQGIVDGLLTFFGSLGAVDVSAALLSTPHVAETALVTAGIAGIIAGLNSYRRAAGASAAPASAPAA